MNINIFLITLLILFISGCNSINIVKNHKIISEKNIPNVMFKLDAKTGGKYKPDWVQPVNKKERCEILYEGYSGGEIYNDEIEPERSWEGECKNGKAHGLGRILSNYKSFDHSEIGYLEEGKGGGFFYENVLNSDLIGFGRYIRENDKLIRRLINYAEVDSNGRMEVYAWLDNNIKTEIGKGVLIQKSKNYWQKYIGIFGDKFFYGKIEQYDNYDKLTVSSWGYFNLETHNLELYGILKYKRQNKILHVEFENGEIKERVQLPESYINSIRQAVTEGKKAERVASNAGRLALIMKKKYEQTHKNNNTSVNYNDKKPVSPNQTFTGTGFFVSNDGFLLTSAHIVANSKNIKVLYKNNKNSATVISIDKTNDIALIKIDEATEFIPIAEYTKIEKGESVTSLGFPLIGLQGNELKATFGHINSLSGIQNDIRFLQFDNPTQPGNSGSPLINEKGEVIAIVSGKLNQDTTIKYSGTLSQNVNYAIRIDYALPIIKQNNIHIKRTRGSKKIANTEIVKRYENSVALIIAEK